MATAVRLVTIGSECFEAEFRGVGEYHDRDGVVHKFYLHDIAKKRGTRLVSTFTSGTLVATANNYKSREELARLNAIRRAFDRGELSFDAQFEERQFKELSLSPQDFEAQAPRTDAEICQYIAHKAYWLAYRYPLHAETRGVLYPIPFDEPVDLEYLGVDPADVWRNIRRMEAQGLLEKVLDGHARPSESMLSGYESGDLSGLVSSLETNAPPAGASDDRRFAELAIEEARKSVAEDDRTHPKVGVVVVKDGRILASAHRGETPESHAEFIALEKKLSSETVIGATVYTTLEPCTTRNHPKVPCAVRLAERKVGRVVIGMLDPDDRISGRGQRALRKAGIATDLFPHDLMAKVEELNRDFIRDRESRESHGEKDKQVVPDFYNFGGAPGPISLSGSAHSVKGPWMDVWGVVTIVNPTQAPMKIGFRRLVLGGREYSLQSMFFKLKSDSLHRFDRISIMGNSKEHYEVHVMFCIAPL